MIFYIFIFFIIILLLYCYRLKLFIDFPSFFKRGFTMYNSPHRPLLLLPVSKVHGKTYSSIKFLIDMKLKFNYTIITNVRSFRVFDDTLYFSKFEDIITFILNLSEDEQSNYIIFFDEIFTILEKKTSLNKEYLSFISQLRKRNIIMITTAQEWLEINITFRRYVRYQVDCNMLSIPFVHKALIINEINDGYQLKWSQLDNEYIAPRLQTKISKGNLSIVQSYDTFETISV